MNYELALKLKEAGFPQLGCGRMLLLDKPLPESDQTVTELSRERYCTTIIDYNKYGEDVYSPTLEELIEACGELSCGNREYKFILWYTKEDGWHAGYYKYGDGYYIDDYPSNNESGTTPIEAVANLWLALNKPVAQTTGFLV